MRHYIPKPRLKNYIARYKTDTELLKKYPEDSKEAQLLKKRIERHKNDIINYVTSESFEAALNAFHL